MAKGHTIPLLDFAKILLRRAISVTVVTTPANRPFIAESLNGTAASVVTLPFPAVANIPSGVESMDQLPSMSVFKDFITATPSMQPHFDQLFQTLPRVAFMVTDFFLWWTLHSANKFGIPRFVFNRMSCYNVSVLIEAMRSGILRGSQPDHELVQLTRFPRIRLCKEDFESHIRNPNEAYKMDVISSTRNSKGILVNSFYELERTFVDYINTESSPKSWCVGPLCLTEWRPKVYSDQVLKPTWLKWLDHKLEEKRRVLYVAFGSQAEISREQLEQIAIGLEESNVCFLWVLRKNESEWGLTCGFEERVRGRGIVIREWVDQREILMHESVERFVSHCGWNSVLESICAGVPIVAWPFLAEQFLNTRMVEQELNIG